MGSRDDVEISLVVPMHNEEETAGIFLETVVPILEEITLSYEIVCVNDGSRDRTLELLRRAHLANPRIKVVDLSRRFGKEAALTAAIDYARGRAVIPIDADLQDPPELIPELVARWREGYDVVLACRVDRQGDSVPKRVTAQLFYRLINRTSEMPMPANVGDFRLLDRRVVQALALMPERTRFMKGIFAWLGFRETTVPYQRPARVAGESKWRFGPLWNLAMEGIVSFTTLPLKIWSYLGFGCAVLAMAFMIVVIVRTLLFGADVPGYASLLSVILFFNGLILISLGIIGEYLSRIFLEVKARPIYLVREALGFEGEATPPLAEPSRKRERPVRELAGVGYGREP